MCNLSKQTLEFNIEDCKEKSKKYICRELSTKDVGIDIILTREYCQTVNHFFKCKTNDSSRGIYIPLYMQNDIIKKIGKNYIVINLDRINNITDLEACIVHELCHYVFDKKYLIVTENDIAYTKIRLNESEYDLYNEIWRKYTVFSEANAKYWQEKYRLTQDKNITDLVRFYDNYLNEFQGDDESILSNSELQYSLGVSRFLKENICLVDDVNKKGARRIVNFFSERPQWNKLFDEKSIFVKG